jgi:hypothetical protein
MTTKVCEKCASHPESHKHLTLAKDASRHRIMACRHVLDAPDSKLKRVSLLD